MTFYFLTLFPEMIEAAVAHSIIRRAMDTGAIAVRCINIREFAHNKHKQVDDYPYGGGAGMVMQPQPVYAAYLYAREQAGPDAPVVYLTPQGQTFSQQQAHGLAKHESLILLCGHYEGIDERVIEEIAPIEISIGDYVLTGGELPALVLADCVARLQPNVLGSPDSFVDESFENGLLEYPQYTRPPEFMGRKVPEVLLSGHHANIEKWRKAQALARTMAKRPDLLQ